MFVSLVIQLVLGVCWLFPTPQDAHGWGVRVRPGPGLTEYLVGEDLNSTVLNIVLINQSSAAREYVPLEAAPFNGDLGVAVTCPNGDPLPTLKVRRVGMGEVGYRKQLPAGRIATSAFAVETFRYTELPSPGEYQIRATLKTPEGKVTAPVLKFTAVEPAADAILSSHPVPLEGFQMIRPKDEQPKAVVQQIKLGTLTFLVYRHFYPPKYGGTASFSARLAELPGKCEVSVTGAYGDWKPLRITYKTSPTAEPVKLVINSVDGKPWTAEEERQLQDRLKREASDPKKP